MRKVTGIGWLIWGWVPALAWCFTLETLWRILCLRKLISFRKGIDNDPLIKRFYTTPFVLGAVPLIIFSILILVSTLNL